MNKPINLKDNSQIEIENIIKEFQLSDIQLNTLSNLANKSLKDLLRDNPKLLIFPDSFNTYVKGLENDKIFELNKTILTTHNIMGFIGQGNLKFQIHSRFDSNEKQFFIHYLLSKVFALNLVDLKNTAGSDNIWAFLLHLIFTSYLNKALRQGLYKKYVRRYYNQTNVKGVIDMQAHIKQNVPFTGKIAFSTREFSFDNPVR